MEIDKNILPQTENYGREYSGKYDEEYYRGYDMKGCTNNNYDRRCDDKEYNVKCKDCNCDKEYQCYEDDKRCEHYDYNKKCDLKVLQTKVIKGKGCEDFFLEADFDFPCDAPLYLIESIDTWVDVYDTKVISESKVIFNAWVYKNIIYKVHDDVETKDDMVTVTGRVNHITKAIPLAGCIDIDTKKCGKLDPCRDFAEVIEACVIGHVEDKLGKKEIKKCGKFDPCRDFAEACVRGHVEDRLGQRETKHGNEVSFNPPVFVYKSLHEKMCVRIKVKVVRWEHVTVEVNEKC